MSEHLLLVSLGPVQEFIAQARRSRDLWFGSHALSELSRAAAKALADKDAELIFPALKKGCLELEECDGPERTVSMPPISIANKILAKVTGTTEDARALAEEARKAVASRWWRIANRVRDDEKVKAALAQDFNDVWKEQIEDAPEFYAVWAPLQPDNYGATREPLEQALVARKHLREFKPWQHDRANGFEKVQKSSLDGARVSVLVQERSGRQGQSALRRLGIRRGEQLDAVGLVKRAGFSPDQFVPLPNVAAAWWLSQVAKKPGAPEALERLRQACKDQKIKRIWTRSPCVDQLPFDASVLYPPRLPAVFEELDIDDADKAHQWGIAHVAPLLKAMRSSPSPYVACLVADGDNMGPAIESLKHVKENQDLSRELAHFPGDARAKVEEKLGSLIYSGGDDVLAFLPVATALACARELHAAFHQRMQGVKAIQQYPTLSVGIGIGHVLEPMGVLLELGREAERAAKAMPNKNALGIIVDKRSGGRRQIALHWNDTPRLDGDDVRLLNDKLSTGKVHALEDLLTRFPRPDAKRDQPELARALTAYANDLLKHAAERALSLDLQQLGVPPSEQYAALYKDIRRAIERLLVVRNLIDGGMT